MTIEARPVVKNKYWIVEKDGEKVATIQVADNGVVYVQGGQRSKYPSIKLLGKANNIKFVRNSATRKPSILAVYDYPCHSFPYNALYDLKLRLPLYTTGKKSKSYYCAGYYLVQLGSHWIIEFCPKKIILTRNKFRGPYLTKELAMMQLKTDK